MAFRASLCQGHVVFEKSAGVILQATRPIRAGSELLCCATPSQQVRFRKATMAARVISSGCSVSQDHSETAASQGEAFKSSQNQLRTPSPKKTKQHFSAHFSPLKASNVENHIKNFPPLLENVIKNFAKT